MVLKSFHPLVETLIRCVAKEAIYAPKVFTAVCGCCLLGKGIGVTMAMALDALFSFASFCSMLRDNFFMHYIVSLQSFVK